MLDRLRQRLASADALLPLCFVGIASGVATAAVILAFRFVTEQTQIHLLGLSGPEAYESLGLIERVALPVGAGLVIGAIYHMSSIRSRQVGVVHVMERLAYHAGRLPLLNAVMQFCAGSIAIIGGHSIGREGPVVHLGAAVSSLLGQWFRLPNNSLRTLVACGTAASIGASFNTPIAGVIFAMEVVLMEYSIVGFTPVILAAVAATSITRIIYGSAPAFDVPALEMTSGFELPFILLLGVVIGALAAGFIRSIHLLDHGLRNTPLWARTTLAGLITGSCALLAPEVMGIGYDTVEMALLGEIGLASLLVVAAMKFFATSACVSLGSPGGLIGPTLFIGATVGGALGILGNEFAPEQSAHPAFYAMLGMGAMMGATLQAPLAALMGLLELTANPNVILPAMLAIVTAAVTSRAGFRQDSVFISMLKARGLDYLFDPVSVSLSRTGVGAVMSRRFTTGEERISFDDATQIVDSETQWMLVTRNQTIAYVLPTMALAGWIESAEAERDPAQDLDLSNCPGAIPATTTVRLQATLSEALERIEADGNEVVLVTRHAVAFANGVYGILSRDSIESSVRYQR